MAAPNAVKGPRGLLELHEDLQQLLALGQHPVLAAQFHRVMLEQLADADLAAWIGFGRPVAFSLAKRIPRLPLCGLSPEDLDALLAVLRAAQERETSGLAGSSSWLSACAQATLLLEQAKSSVQQLLEIPAAPGPDSVDGSAAVIWGPVVARPVTRGAIHPLFAEQQAGQILQLRVDAHLTLGRSAAARVAIDGDASPEARSAVERAIGAVDELSARGAPGGAHCGFRLAWRPAEARMVGRSAGLPILLAAAEARTRLAPGFLERRLTSGLAATGEMEGTHVQPVEPSTLRLKTRAAFFSPVRTLCVPVSQRGLVLEEVRRLEDAHPQRQLLVRGIADARELWDDRDVVRPHPRTVRGAAATTLGWALGSRIGLAAGVLALALAGGLTTAELVRSRNLPVEATWVADRLVTRNAYGRVCREIPFPAGSNPGVALGGPLGRIVDVCNINKSAPNEILTLHCGTASQRDSLCAIDRNGQKLWTIPAADRARTDDPADMWWLAFYPVPHGSGPLLRLLGLRRSVASCFTAVDVIHAATGKVQRTFLNAGHLESVWEIHLMNDRTKEWGLVGTDQATGFAILVLVDPVAFTEPAATGELRSALVSEAPGVLDCLRFAPSIYATGIRVSGDQIKDAEGGAKRVAVSSSQMDAVNYYLRFSDLRHALLQGVQITDMFLNLRLRAGKPLTDAERVSEEERLADSVQVLTPSGWTRIGRVTLPQGQGAP